MNMKRIAFAMVMLLSAACAAASAQTRSAKEYAERHALLTGRFGTAGIGVETLVSNWEKDYPEDIDMLCAKFSFYFAKSQSSSVVVKDQAKFMGSKPVISLPDTVRKTTVNYFQETFYDDSLFAISTQAIDKAIRLSPMEIDLRFNRITALIAYEKESPDMAREALLSLVDYNYTASPQWTFKGAPLEDGFFCDAIQEYCYSFFVIASETSMAAFRAISERMLRYDPLNTTFLDDIGSYEFAWKHDNKAASKQFRKVLKINGDDYTAIKNLTLIARADGDAKAEVKWLGRLRDVTRDEEEKSAVEKRLIYLGRK